MEPRSRLPGRPRRLGIRLCAPATDMTVRDKHAEDANISSAPALHARLGLMAELDPDNA